MSILNSMNMIIRWTVKTYQTFRWSDAIRCAPNNEITPCKECISGQFPATLLLLFSRGSKDLETIASAAPYVWSGQLREWSKRNSWKVEGLLYSNNEILMSIAGLLQVYVVYIIGFVINHNSPPSSVAGRLIPSLASTGLPRARVVPSSGHNKSHLGRYAK